MDRAIAIQGLVDVVSRLNSQAILIFHAADFGAAKTSSSVFRARLNNFLSSMVQVQYIGNTNGSEHG